MFEDTAYKNWKKYFLVLLYFRVKNFYYFEPDLKTLIMI